MCIHQYNIALNSKAAVHPWSQDVQVHIYLSSCVVKHVSMPPKSSFPRRWAGPATTHLFSSNEMSVDKDLTAERDGPSPFKRNLTLSRTWRLGSDTSARTTCPSTRHLQLGHRYGASHHKVRPASTVGTGASGTGACTSLCADKLSLAPCCLSRQTKYLTLSSR